MRGFTIRLAKEKDLRTISRFGKPVVKELTFYNKEQMANNIREMSLKDLKATLKENKHSIIIATTSDGNIAGMCTHFPGFGHVDWLDWGLVGKRFRRKGVRKAMLNFEIREAKRYGCHKMLCVTHPKNEAAIKFFRRAGFKRVGLLTKHSFRQDEILWEKLF